MIISSIQNSCRYRIRSLMIQITILKFVSDRKLSSCCDASLALWPRWRLNSSPSATPTGTSWRWWRWRRVLSSWTDRSWRSKPQMSKTQICWTPPTSNGRRGTAGRRSTPLSERGEAENVVDVVICTVLQTCFPHYHWCCWHIYWHVFHIIADVVDVFTDMLSTLLLMLLTYLLTSCRWHIVAEMMIVTSLTYCRHIVVAVCPQECSDVQQRADGWCSLHRWYSRRNPESPCSQGADLGTCIIKQVQLSLGLSGLSGFTQPNIVRPA